uniref:Uncharacterized protein n=1 Tax=Anguilla anguilla TaxID=7936 RepID=A0A0E9RVU9_ANGAN
MCQLATATAVYIAPLRQWTLQSYH